MATPAERIYEAAAAALGAQQETVTRITGTVAPVGTAAAAAALLIKPALVKVDQAGVVQVAGLVLGAIGVLSVLTATLAVLRGVQMKDVEPAKLLEATKSDASMLADGQRFHHEVADNEDRERGSPRTAAGRLRANDRRARDGDRRVHARRCCTLLAMPKYKPEMVQALRERVGLSEDDAKRSVEVVDEVLADEQSQQPKPGSAPLGEFFKDAIVTKSTGFLTAPTTLGLRRRRKRRQHSATV